MVWDSIIINNQRMKVFRVFRSSKLKIEISSHDICKTIIISKQEILSKWICVCLIKLIQAEIRPVLFVQWRGIISCYVLIILLYKHVVFTLKLEIASQPCHLFNVLLYESVQTCCMLQSWCSCKLLNSCTV